MMALTYNKGHSNISRHSNDKQQQQEPQNQYTGAKNKLFTHHFGHQTFKLNEFLLHIGLHAQRYQPKLPDVHLR